MMNCRVFVSFAVLLLAATPVLANYPCPGGPGAGEQQIGVAGGSHGIAEVPICAETGVGYGGDAGGSGGGVGGYRCDGCNIFADPGPPSYDAMSIAINEYTAKNLQAQKQMQAAEAKLQAMEADPAYQQFQKGSWKFFQGKKDSAPGENCTAMWAKEGGLVSITGPGPSYQGGMLTFWSPDIPKPATTQTVAVTLKQSQYQPQSVNALNFSVPNVPFGAIALTVPTIDAALNTMLDVEQFQLEMGGKVVADVGWTDGLAARARLQQCINGR